MGAALVGVDLWDRVQRDQFPYGQFQRQFPADLDRTVIDPNKSANHEDAEQQAKSSPFADVTESILVT